MLWVETPSNPLLKLIDLAAVAKIAREHDLISVADNTFASPWIQRPLELGFDIVVHSATKYLNGHSDMVGGVVVIGGEPRLTPLAERLAYLQNAVGGVSGPFDSFLALRGLKTLALRMERHCANAQELALWLSTQPEVARVHYPGTCLASAARAGEAADARVWRHGHDRARRPTWPERSASSSAAACLRWPRAWAASKA